MMNNTEKTLDRIRKLMAMAGDSGSPNEAAIAMKRARLLMDKHQISELDLKTETASNLGEAKIIYFDTWAGRLALQIAKLNDCIVSLDQSDNGLPIVRFKGYLVDAVTCQEMFPYLCACSTNGAKPFKGKSAKLDFHQGFAAGIQEQIAEIIKERATQTLSNGQSLVIVKKNIVEQKFGVQKYGKSRSRKVSNSYYDGVKAGKNTSLNRQIN